MNRFGRPWMAAALAALLALLSIHGVGAHGSHANPIQTFTQVVAGHEIGVTVEIPPSTPSPLLLDIVVPPDIGAATLTLRAAPRGQSFDQASAATVQTAADGEQPIYYAELAVDRPGDWEIELRAESTQGSGVALIPFTITPAPLPPYSVPLLAALGSLVGLMIVTIAIASVFNSRRKTIPNWLSWVMGRAILVALVVVVIFGALQLNDSVQAARASAAGATYLPAGSVVTSAGRPHVNMALDADPTAPTVGKPLNLAVTFTDGGTGLPVDDIVTHHDALVHLAVLSEDGSFFLHTHPARIAPGEYAIEMTPTQPGRYTAYAEIERVDSGTQVLRGEFTVAGDAAARETASGFGTRTIGDVQVTVAASQPTVVANQQATLTFSFRGANGQPIRTMQPWLGMAGHLMARSDDGVIFAHVHAAERMPPYGRPILVNGTAYGPDIRFVYTFPSAGRYQVWGQFKYDGQILTVPLSVDVVEG